METLRMLAWFPDTFREVIGEMEPLKVTLRADGTLIMADGPSFEERKEAEEKARLENNKRVTRGYNLAPKQKKAGPPAPVLPLPAPEAGATITDLNHYRKQKKGK
jgi:hypothetical protein